MGVKPMVAGWKAQTNPLSYGGTPFVWNFDYFSGSHFGDDFNFLSATFTVRLNCHWATSQPRADD